MFSFHGVPRSTLLRGDPYHCQCQKSARLVAEALELTDDEWILSFQSRVGREEWLRPYTDETIERLGKEGTRRLDVVCPGFSTDCLETLEMGYAIPKLIYASQTARHILSLLLFRNPALPVQERAESRRGTCDAAIEYMHAHLAEPVTLDELANSVGLSVSYFSEVFRDETHHSPIAFLAQLRVRAACHLLDLTDKPVKVVATEIGYRDPYYFSRVFKKNMGVSPQQYRAIKKG